MSKVIKETISSQQKITFDDRLMSDGQTGIPRDRLEQIINFHLKKKTNFRINETRFYRAGMITLATAIQAELDKYDSKKAVNSTD